MQQSDGFRGLGLAPAVLSAVERLGFSTPTPIQQKSIPIVCDGKDLIGIAQTGTGKTLAFGLPAIARVLATEKRVLIVLPTRELAAQVNESLLKVGGPLGIRTAVLIGGEYIVRQLRSLSRKPQIIIGTPGRLNDHIQQKTISFSEVGMVILDEADRMLDMGFAPQIKKVMEAVPRERQTLLFSATMPDEIVRIASSYMKLPVRVEIAPAGTTAQKVSQELFFVGKDSKLSLLEKLLSEYKGSVLVFTRTKHAAKKIAAVVRAAGYSSCELHSNRSLTQRRDALEGFKAGRYRVMVATDIAARGIDVVGIELVVNFDLPQMAEDYVHRIGRTGRAGLSGHAISFATPDQRGSVREIERLIRSVLPQSKVPSELLARRTPTTSTSSSLRRFSRYPHRPQGVNTAHIPHSSHHTSSAKRPHAPTSFGRRHVPRRSASSRFHPDQYQGSGDGPSRHRPNR